jgi:hypothetical protein
MKLANFTQIYAYSFKKLGKGWKSCTIQDDT